MLLPASCILQLTCAMTSGQVIRRPSLLPILHAPVHGAPCDTASAAVQLAEAARLFSARLELLFRVLLRSLHSSNTSKRHQ